jgi:uncharacterized protein
MTTLLARWSALLVLLFGIAFGQPASAEPVFPPLAARVVDEAGILPEQAEAELASRLQTLEDSTSRQLVVVIVSSLQGYEIEDYGYRLGRAWGIGEARKNTGVLFLVAPVERRVRIEVGYGLEPVLTDAISTAILEQNVLPRFRSGEVATGIVAGADALIEQLSLPVDQAHARALAVASGEAKADPLSIVIVGFILFWFVVGLIGTIRWNMTEIWLWPLLLLMGSDRRGGKDVFRGRGGSFGGGGASGRW